MAPQQSGARRGDGDEVCPVCKSSRYLNPNMRFLINPECYHKMCESCVDRIFSSGPALCPVAGCHKTLRKNRFRTQTFEDIGVEREVDIRKRVMEILNRREDEFADSRSYNDFLEQREEIIASLVHPGPQTAAVDSQLATYAATHGPTIARAAALDARDARAAADRAELERAATIGRRRQAAIEEEVERTALAEGRQEVVDRIAAARSAGEAERVAREGRLMLLKKQQAKSSLSSSTTPTPTPTPGPVPGQGQADGVVVPERLKAGNGNNKVPKRKGPVKSSAATPHDTTPASMATGPEPDSSGGGGLLIRGLKQPTTTTTTNTTTTDPVLNNDLDLDFDLALDPEQARARARPYDPYAGRAHVEKRDYYTLAPNGAYTSQFLERERRDGLVMAGGYATRDWCERVLTEAFAGLAVFVGEEVAARERKGGEVG